jgi:mono/diheme cytochrome c family protein
MMKTRRAIALSLMLFVGIVLGIFPKPLFGGDQQRAKELIQQTCVQCHRLEGKADSRFNLKAPDLIWAGSKYQRPWLIRWLTGKEAPLYAKGYRWDLDQTPTKHPTVTQADAEAIADYFDQHNKDPRVKVGAFDVSKVSKFEASFGGMAYKAHACLGCHVIEENGKIIGGATTRTGSSASGKTHKTSCPTAGSFWRMRRSRSYAR